jgi:hypothetical protein
MRKRLLGILGAIGFVATWFVREAISAWFFEKVLNVVNIDGHLSQVVEYVPPAALLGFTFWMFLPDIKRRIYGAPPDTSKPASLSAIVPSPGPAAPSLISERKYRKYYSIPEAASATDISAETIYQLAIAGEVVLSIVEHRSQNYEIPMTRTDDDGRIIHGTRRIETVFSAGHSHSPPNDLWFIRPADAKDVIRNPPDSVTLIHAIFSDRNCEPRTGKGFLNNPLRVSKDDLKVSSSELDRLLPLSGQVAAVPPQGTARRTSISLHGSNLPRADRIGDESFANRECIACKYADYGPTGTSSVPECLKSRDEVMGRWNACRDVRANRNWCAGGTWFEPRDNA